MFLGKEAMYDQVREIVAQRKGIQDQSGKELLIDRIIDIAKSEQQLLELGLIYVIGGYHTTGIGKFRYSTTLSCFSKLYQDYIKK